MGIVLDSALKNKNVIQGLVQSYLYLLGIISNPGSVPYPQDKVFMLSFLHSIKFNYCESRIVTTAEQLFHLDPALHSAAKL